MYYKECEIKIGEIRTLVDLVKLGGMEYDVILGMDWLSACCAKINCPQKRIIFKMDGVLEFIFEGNQNKRDVLVISVIKATKLLK